MSQEGLIEKEHLPSKWVLVIYGVKAEDKILSTRLRWIVKKYGLWSIDRGGSVYIGLSNPDLDKALQSTVDTLRDKYGDLSQTFHMITGEYDEPTTDMFKTSVTESVLDDINLVNESMITFEKAMVGEVEIKRHDGTPANLLTVGELRISNAKRILEGAENVLYRFQKEDINIEQLKTRIEQVRAWVEKIESVYREWAKMEKAKQKSKPSTSQ